MNLTLKGTGTSGKQHVTLWRLVRGLGWDQNGKGGLELAGRVEVRTRQNARPTFPLFLSSRTV
jgi:hypothetical protein